MNFNYITYSYWYIEYIRYYEYPICSVFLVACRLLQIQRWRCPWSRFTFCITDYDVVSHLNINVYVQRVVNAIVATRTRLLPTVWRLWSVKAHQKGIKRRALPKYESWNASQWWHDHIYSFSSALSLAPQLSTFMLSWAARSTISCLLREDTLWAISAA